MNGVQDVFMGTENLHKGLRLFLLELSCLQRTYESSTDQKPFEVNLATFCAKSWSFKRPTNVLGTRCFWVSEL